MRIYGEETDDKPGQGFSAAQYLIDFDTLDGVVVDRESGTVSLFGHRRDKKNLLRIPYFDFLATALECKNPAMSLDHPPEYDSLTEKILDRSVELIKDAVREPFDKDMRLTKASAWLLQQGGVAARSQSTHWETLAAMLRASGKEDSADLMDRMQACANAQPEESAAAYLQLYKSLGISTAFQEIEHRIKGGTITADQASDAFNPLYLKAIAQELGLEADRYVLAYEEGRRRAKSPKDTMKWLQQFHVESDVRTFFKKIRNKVLAEAHVMPAPPWIAQELLAPNAPQVIPTFEDLPRTSWAARTMFQADVLMKQFFYGASIRRHIPKFRTYLEFMMDTAAHEYKAAMASEDHVWERMQILPGAFKLLETPDGDGIRFQDAPMRFIVHRFTRDANGERRDIDDPIQVFRNSYAAELSAQYNDLAQIFPTLWKLRECAKMIAVARWLESQGIRTKLPSGERLTWIPPDSTPFSMAISFSLDEDRLQRHVIITGGVSLAPQASWDYAKEPIIVPRDARKANLPRASNAAQIRDSLTKTTDVNEIVTLQVSLAQELNNAGDTNAAMREIDKALKLDPDRNVLWLLAAVSRSRNGELLGAQEALQEYVKRDPENAAAQKLLEGMQKNSSRSDNAQTERRLPASGGPIAEQPSKAVALEHVTDPFKWNSPALKSVYTNDERAPELTDVSIRPLKYAYQRPSPAIPDYLALQPELKALQVRRNALIQDYQSAPKGKTEKIREEIEKADQEVINVIKKYENPSDNQGQEPQQKTKETLKKDFEAADDL